MTTKKTKLGSKATPVAAANPYATTNGPSFGIKLSPVEDDILTELLAELQLLHGRRLTKAKVMRGLLWMVKDKKITPEELLRSIQTILT
jgi:hypothetical protein